MSDFTKTYSNGEVTIVWKPDLCIHSTKCFRGLPTVFNPRVKPWIDPSASTTEDIINQVRLCPSGALSIQQDEQSADPPATVTASAPPTSDVARITIQQNGPYLVSGPVTMKLPDGSEVMQNKTVALCSCGRSASMPTCDCSGLP